MTKQSLKVDGVKIALHQIREEDYFSLNDMAGGGRKASRIIYNWLQTIGTLEYLAEWEYIYNPDFNYLRSQVIRNEAGTIRFTMSVKEWIEETRAIGLISKAGRYGGTYAHRDIAFEFGTRISARFKILLIREFQRLKAQEYDRQKLEWDANRFLARRNYAIHTDAIKHNLLPTLSPQEDESWIVYAGEADLLNVAVFNRTAKAWREANPEKAKKGHNMRDYASNEELIVLSNLEAINSELIREAITKEERFWRLRQTAVYQLGILLRERPKPGKRLEE